MTKQHDTQEDCYRCAILENHNGWNEWRNHVLSELKRANDERAEIFKALNNVNNKLSEYRGVTKGQATIISMAFSSIGGIITFFLTR